MTSALTQTFASTNTRELEPTFTASAAAAVAAAGVNVSIADAVMHTNMTEATTQMTTSSANAGTAAACASMPPSAAVTTAGAGPTTADVAAAAAATVSATASVVVEQKPLPEQNISYSAERIIGNGSFGVVFEAKVVETGEVVAIKKVLQDKRFKNRELQIMRQLVKDPHPNIVALQHCFYSQVRALCYFHVLL